MPGISRVGRDSAGGAIIGRGASNVYVNGSLVAVKGDKVASHGKSPHKSPSMVGASSRVYANGIAVCRQGDSATCGHKASGSSDVSAG